MLVEDRGTASEEEDEVEVEEETEDEDEAEEGSDELAEAREGRRRGGRKVDCRGVAAVRLSVVVAGRRLRTSGTVFIR